MDIFIPRLPQATSEHELLRLIKKVLAQKIHLPFTQQPVVTSCAIILIRDGRGITDAHGLIGVQPDSAGKWLISHFKHQFIHKKQVYARKYYRRVEGDTGHFHGNERRRPHLDIQKKPKQDVYTEDMSQFARQRIG